MKWKKVIASHKCELLIEDLLENLFPGDSVYDKTKRACKRLRTISMTNQRARRIFKSTTAIDFERFRHLKTYSYIIHPYSDFRQRWEIFLMFAYLWGMFLTPFYQAFIMHNPNKRSFYVWITLDIIQCLFYFLDIAINFSTGYVKSDRTDGVVLVPWKISVHYIRTYFFIDILSAIPFSHVACAMQTVCEWCDTYESFRYLRVFRLRTLKQYTMRFCEIRGIPDIAAEIAWNFIRILILVHFVTCGYMALGSTLLTYTDTWLEERAFEDMGITELYFQAMMLTAANFRCLGYGFKDPADTLIQLYIVLVAIIGTFNWIYFIASILKYVSITNVGANKYEQLMVDVAAYGRHKQLPLDLERRVKEYFDFRYEMRYFDERQLLSSFSNTIRQECLMYSCRRLLLNVTFFNNIPTSLLLRIMASLHAEIYLVNDVIVKAGSTEDKMYFITSGTVAVYTPRGKEVCHLEDGAHFGEIALLSEPHERQASVVAIESCELYSLDKADFDRAIAPYPDLLTRLERVAEERLERIARVEKVDSRAWRRSKRKKEKRRDEIPSLGEVYEQLHALKRGEDYPDHAADRDSISSLSLIIESPMSSSSESLFSSSSSSTSSLPLDDKSQLEIRRYV